ncbi:MAG: menaquinone biosynthesis protein [Calditrichaeota bacterium]|nr:menaquinone biosynthesis protein [Calditrichota bacterium]
MKRIGISTYLNTQPVAYALQNKLVVPDFQFVEALPHECSLKLRERELEAALIPSIEYVRGNDDYYIYDGFCISSKRTIKSVELFFKKDLTDIKTVALDATSRTSVALLRILLEEKWGLEPEYITMPPNIDKMFEKADAALIIADNALDLYDQIPNRFDLAEEWYDFTGLPFVFAFIAGFDKSLTPYDMNMLKNSLDYGQSHLPQICADWAAKHPKFSAEYYQDYLENNVSFEFGDAEKESLSVFYDYAFLRNLIPYYPDIKFYSHIEIDENS